LDRPVINSVRKADGTTVVQDPCCTLVQRWLGDHTSPILKPQAAEAVKKFGELALSGTVAPDLHNTCWPEPPPYVMALHFGVQILQREDEITLLYLLYNTVRHIRLNAPHPENLTPSWQGHSVGSYEGGTLVIDTVGIKVAPLSTVDAFGTPHSKALHVVERYRLIDGEAAAEAQRKHGAEFRPNPPYGRGTIDQDTSKKGLQVEFTVEDPAFLPRLGPDELPIGASSATGRKRPAPRIRSRKSRFLRRKRRISDHARASPITGYPNRAPIRASGMPAMHEFDPKEAS
jgi:hypothetical protein